MADVYVKVSLLLQSKVVKTKKTEVIRRSVNPSFNESFTFKLAPDSLDAASITITAMQNNTAHVRGKPNILRTNAHIGLHAHIHTQTQIHTNTHTHTNTRKIVWKIYFSLALSKARVSDKQSLLLLFIYENGWVIISNETNPLVYTSYFFIIKHVFCCACQIFRSFIGISIM